MIIVGLNRCFYVFSQEMAMKSTIDGFYKLGKLRIVLEIGYTENLVFKY